MIKALQGLQGKTKGIEELSILKVKDFLECNKFNTHFVKFLYKDFANL